MFGNLTGTNPWLARFLALFLGQVNKLEDPSNMRSRPRNKARSVVQPTNTSCDTKKCRDDHSGNWNIDLVLSESCNHKEENEKRKSLGKKTDPKTCPHIY